MPSPRAISMMESLAPASSVMVWRGWKSIGRCASGVIERIISVPASTPAATWRRTPSSASMVLSATMGSAVWLSAKAGSSAKGVKPTGGRGGGKAGLVAAVDQDDARELRQVVDDGGEGDLVERLAVAGFGERAEAGVAPGFGLDAGQAGGGEGFSGGVADGGVTGQAGAQAAIAGEEGVGAVGG